MYLNIRTALPIALFSSLSDGQSCPGGWDHYNGNCFYTSSNRENYQTARSDCQGMNADLASISDREENNFVEGIS